MDWFNPPNAIPLNVIHPLRSVKRVFQRKQYRRILFLSWWRLTVRCHSERMQACFVRKMGSGNMTQSEESITVMTFYRLTHHGSRFFAVALDDAWPSFSLRQQILRCRSGWRLTVFLTTAADSSLSLWMTPDRLAHHYSRSFTFASSVAISYLLLQHLSDQCRHKWRLLHWWPYLRLYL